MQGLRAAFDTQLVVIVKGASPQILQSDRKIVTVSPESDSPVSWVSLG
jgi:hypothetical protein